MKKRLFLLSAISALFLLGAGCVDTAAINSFQQQTSPSYQTISTTSQSVEQPANDTSGGLSNDNHYTNSSGDTVHSPAYETQQDVVPAGATARCADGTYSFSQHRSGTCSHHGGVAEWL